MSHSRWMIGGASCALAAALGAPSHAGPRVTLNLENVTLREAARALQKETGWDFRINHSAAGEDTPADEKPVRASFSWTDAALGRACRDLGDKFGFTPKSWGQQVVNFEPGAARTGSPYSSRRGGYQFVATRVSRFVSAELQLGPHAGAVRPGAGGKPVVSRTGSLTLVVRAEGGDVDPIRGLENLRFVTDSGEARSSSDGPLFRQGSSYGPLDEWEAHVGFADIPAGARQIRKLSGELVAYRRITSARTELPLPLPAGLTRRAVGPVALAIKGVETDRREGLRFDVDAEWRADIRFAGDVGGSPAPLVRFQSGTLAPVSWSGQEGGSGNGMQRSRMECTIEIGDPDDPPVALVWDLTFQTDPSVRIPFRIENIPLPAFPGDRPAAGRPVPALPAEEMPATGTLLSPVLVDGKPAGGRGTVQFGLSRRVGAGWGPVRWQSADLEGGVAQLEGLAPGTYRVQRILQLLSPGGMLERARGRWKNEVTTIQVQAGKSAKLPPLERVP